MAYTHQQVYQFYVSQGQDPNTANRMASQVMQAQANAQAQPPVAQRPPTSVAQQPPMQQPLYRPPPGSDPLNPPPQQVQDPRYGGEPPVHSQPLYRPPPPQPSGGQVAGEVAQTGLQATTGLSQAGALGATAAKASPWLAAASLAIEAGKKVDQHLDVERAERLRELQEADAKRKREQQEALMAGMPDPNIPQYRGY